MNIREYVEGDKKRILEIYAQSKLDELKFETVEFKLLPLEKDKDRLSKLYESDIYVYDENGVVAYGAHFHSEISALFVQPGSRGEGIGQKLLEFILSKISEGAFLYVAASNKPAIRLYQKYGFETVDEFETTYNSVDVMARKMVQLGKYN